MPPRAPAKGGAAAVPAPGVALSSSNSSEIEVSLLPVPAADVLFSQWSAENLSNVITNLIADFKDFTSVLSRSSLSGLFFASSTPFRARSAINLELNATTDEQKTFIFNFIRDKIIDLANADSQFDPDISSLWKALVPPRDDLGGGGERNHPPGPENNPGHGGGGADQQTSANQLQMPPPPLFLGAGDLHLRTQDQGLPPPPGHMGVSGNAWFSPQNQNSKPAKFHFGVSRSDSVNPISLVGHFQSPSQNFSGFASPYVPISANVPPSMASNYTPLRANPLLPISAQSQLNGQGSSGPQAASSNAAAVPSSQQFLAAQSQPQNQHLPASNAAAPPSQQFPFLNQLQQQQPQVHHQFQAPLSIPPSRAMFPWDEEALVRPKAVQDPNMMPGFSRKNITMIIEAAKAKRVAMGPEASKNLFHDNVKWPVMLTFTKEEHIRVRKEYQMAVRASHTSCIFKEFKDCMTDTCRSACQRKFQVDDLNWISLDDSKLQHWLAICFGPKSKEDAISRLSAVKFPPHSDAYDSQSTFVTKLDICAYDYELCINDIADTHTRWVSDSKMLSSGALDIKEVMTIWRNKFPRQDNSVFSVQLKECRVFMEREKALLFNEIMDMLTSHFNTIDQDVLSGKVGYTTIPSKSTNMRLSTSDQAIKFPSCSTTNDHVARNPRSDGAGVKRDRQPERRSFASPATRATSKDKPARRVVPGHLRGIACGSITSHFGLGCSATTCPIWGTRHDKNKGGHTWKNSDEEKTVVIDKAEYDALLKAKPIILTKWTAAKDQQQKARFSAKVSAIEAGEDAGSSDSNADDNEALCDEFTQELASDADDNANASVNDDACFVSALAHDVYLEDVCDPGESVLNANRMKQFFGISRIREETGQFSMVKTLMDPGATFNIVGSKISSKCAIQELPIHVELFQGSKRQGIAQIMAQCRFELQNSHGDFVKHVEWCLCSDLGYELLLGRKFCKDNGFTKFEDLLTVCPLWSATFVCSALEGSGNE